ncbi:AaceriAGR018Cp [[Ashbya] aceris (nom. inval.)]|nr:AaceriAGR018Cp [[Ashbya] aceris (nom. inval.)]
MSRLRKFNRELIKYTQGTADSIEDRDDFFPLDTDEQEQLIRKFELRNASKNEKYLQYLGFVYLACCGLMLLLATSAKRVKALTPYRRILLVSVQSIGCSFVNMRYSTITDMFRNRFLPFRISSQAINVINIVILVLISWQVSETAKSGALLVFLHVPHWLFLISILVKHWSEEIDSELNTLRSLTYKFKSA